MNRVTIDIDKLTESEKAIIEGIANREQPTIAAKVGYVPDGGTFEVGGMEFIKFPDEGGKTPVMYKTIAFTSIFGRSNDLTSSEVLRKMQEEVLPKVVAAVGEENVCTFKTDLTTLDGLKPYAPLESRISLPTLDFYRAHVDIFDKHKVDDWYWLATPESAPPHCKPNWFLCVAPSGCISNFNCYYGLGVRPFLCFLSSIFGSCED